MSCFLNIFGCRWCGVSQFHDQVDGQNSLLLIHLLCINYISNYDVPRLDPLTRLINQVMTLKKSTVPETCEVFFFFFLELSCGRIIRYTYKMLSGLHLLFLFVLFYFSFFLSFLC